MGDASLVCWSVKPTGTRSLLDSFLRDQEVFRNEIGSAPDRSSFMRYQGPIFVSETAGGGAECVSTQIFW